MEFCWISLIPGITAAISPVHRFTTDSVLLARFASPRSTERAAELGAGCGALSLLWFGEGETAPRSLVCVELEEQAVELLRMSIARNDLSARITPLCADLRELKNESGLQAGAFDLVVCNPPYFPSPPGATAGSAPRQLARREITAPIGEVAAAAARLLRFGGRFCCCWRPDRLPDLFEALRAHSLEPKRLRPVAAREGAAPSLLLVEATRSGKKELRWLPPLILTGSDGSPSEEYRAIYRRKE